MEDMIFRKLNANDRDLFVKLRMYYLSTEFDINSIDVNEIERNLIRYFDEHILKNDFIGMVCEIDNEVVATAFLIINERPSSPTFVNGKLGVLMNVFTYPDYRKQGIATKLIDKILEEADKENVSVIDLNATKEGENLYKRFGFKEVEYKSMRKNFVHKENCLSCGTNNPNFPVKNRKDNNRIDNLSKEEIGRIFPVEIMPYNAEWQALFEAKKWLLTSILTNGVALFIEHIGSTSVFKLSAKPVIDILVAVPELTKSLKKEITEKLSEIAYENMSAAETETKMTFGKGYDINDCDKQKFHLHIRQKDSDLWNDEVYFRDYLRQNADTRGKYEKLKLRLAQLHKHDREAYTEAKTDFINSITRKAKNKIK
ncbi:MAG: GNAT family N-acetyltransferase [Prevotellaceae bacterium]|jgi:GrpB-like predicted nucleotidyltransferase (UPF0157 family)/GNAT superfamily N-acetyltransferase|nr:GNAT family N-acetyltransferase [Prevotellaceae bacterium]